MSDLYLKDKNGNFTPVSIEKMAGRDWHEKIVWVRLGTEDVPAGEEEETLMAKALENADSLADVNTTFIVTSYQIGFEVLGNAKELQDKCVLIKANSNENLNPLGDNLQKKVKRMLRENKLKSVTMPAPLTVQEYKEVMEVKRRCDIRRTRRG